MKERLPLKCASTVHLDLVLTEHQPEDPSSPKVGINAIIPSIWQV